MMESEPMGLFPSIVKGFWSLQESAKHVKKVPEKE